MEKQAVDAIVVRLVELEERAQHKSNGDNQYWCRNLLEPATFEHVMCDQYNQTDTTYGRYLRVEMHDHFRNLRHQLERFFGRRWNAE